MYRDPTDALKEVILSKSVLCQGVQDILDHQREASATTDEAADALQTYILMQMYGELRKTNPLLAAYEEARASQDISWWGLLFDLGWKSTDSDEDIPI